jgi:3-oxoacid CoA-transferase subunit B
LGVFAIDTKSGSGMSLIELADAVSVEEIKAKTEATFEVALGQQAAA